MRYEHTLQELTPGGKSLHMNHTFHWEKMLAAFRALRQSLKLRSLYMMKTENWKLQNLPPQKQHPNK